MQPNRIGADCLHLGHYNRPFCGVLFAHPRAVAVGLGDDLAFGDRAAAGILLDLVPEATAILSMTVMQALSLCREAARRGVRVPDDLSVVGYNDFPEAARSQPPPWRAS